MKNQIVHWLFEKLLFDIILSKYRTIREIEFTHKMNHLSLIAKTIEKFKKTTFDTF